MPLERYVATVQLKPVTDGRRTFWQWQSTFRAPRGRERELADLVGGDVYEGGFAGMMRYLEQGAVPGRAGPRPGQELAATAVVFAGCGRTRCAGRPNRLRTASGTR